MIKGVIFDFNGTLFKDTDLQEQAWQQLFLEIHKRNIGSTEYRDHFHGRVNDVILDYFLPPEMNYPDREAIPLKKEAIYRRIVRDNPQSIRFVPGVTETLDTLAREGIPFTIATASEITNVRFYFEAFPLERWFSGVESIVYDDGTFPGKPAPDIFLKAAEKLHLSPADCIVVEDSLSGITAAKNAGIGRVIAMDPDLNRAEIEADPQVFAVIDNFENFYDRYVL